MVPKDVSYLLYECEPATAKRYTCAECVRAGAKNVRVFRTAGGLSEHLFVYGSGSVK